jgi:hypothetical protein
VELFLTTGELALVHPERRSVEAAINTKNTNEQPAALPTFLCLPCLVNGIPVDLAMLPFSADTPTALFQENEKPNFLPMRFMPFCFFY